MEISVQGALDAASGHAVDIEELDRLVKAEVLDAFDHRNMNAEIPLFATVVPTSENLALEIDRRLRARWHGAFRGGWPRLQKIRIAETERNIFEVSSS